MNDSAVPPEEDFLPSGTSQDLSSFEFSLITLMFGFQSWVQDCMDAAGFRGLSPMDILVLHAVNHRARDHRQADICRVLNIDDAHLVAYALKKLLAAGLVSAQASGPPPNVVPRSPTPRPATTSSRANSAAAGKPPAMPLPRVTTSGNTP